MKIEQIYTGCLAEAAYYIESEGEAAIIDPLREVDAYIRKAEKNNATIKYVFETHFHADFVSGHVDLAHKTGATIVFGPNAVTDFKAHIAFDGECFKIGKLALKALHTPGHTMESTTYLLMDENGKEQAIFSGDTLFIGDVGRPDLAVKSDRTKEQLAGLLYDSLRTKIMTLPDSITVYPAHGAGSACGKNMSKETTDTLGHQKQVNYALQPMSKAVFIEKVLDGILPAPHYFPKNALMNKQGYESIDAVLKKGAHAYGPEEFEQRVAEEGALVIDTRDAPVFAKGFIPNSINIGLSGQFAPWVGALLTDLKQPLLLVTDLGKEEETVTRLARVGYDATLGYLEGGFDAWKLYGKEVDSILSISAESFSTIFKQELITVLDVRKPAEYGAEHIENVENKPLDFINDWIGQLDKNKTYYLHCAGGYRSMIAASILSARGFKKLIDVDGGFNAIKETDVPKTAFRCPSTLKNKLDDTPIKE